ncbi:hypothetical protein DM02DRAFT_608374 [Periconia macrospinosa]|uniref:Uncharacterized protein n=1 Tax=Periconia macrospinosa TaxID=97972 RepID=A0A2V1EB52_9PLEO|nr:hypothetical protein DM02DRAFT_608374 [Periconia macrospinosa]
MSPLRSLRQPTYFHLSRNTIRLPPSQITLRSRAFHATARREDVTAVFLSLPHSLLTALHEVMPWYAAIPASAVVMRGLLLWGLGLRSREVTVRFIGTEPLRNALRHQKIYEMRNEPVAEDTSKDMKNIQAALKKEVRQLDRRWDCSLRKQLVWGISSLPVYLVMSEVIRRMGDMKNGILGMMWIGMGLKDPDTSLHGVSLGTNEWYEPTFATEGMLWFPNLLEPDPNGYLPFIVSALMLFNVLTKGGKVQFRADPGPIQRAVRGVLIVVSLSVGVVCQEVPAGLMLYWATSTSTVILSNWFMDIKYPVPKGLNRCKRRLDILKPKPASKLPRKPLVRK